MSGYQKTGQVFLLNAGTGHHPENPRHNYLPKNTGKFAYSTHFPFNVLPAGHTYAPDTMVAVTNDDKTYGHRYLNRAFGVAPGFIWTEFFEDMDIDVVWMRAGGLDVGRGAAALHLYPADPPGAVVEAPGALGCSGAAAVTRTSNDAEGWEYVVRAKTARLAIKRLWGYDAQRGERPVPRLREYQSRLPVCRTTAPHGKHAEFAHSQSGLGVPVASCPL